MLKYFNQRFIHLSAILILPVIVFSFINNFPEIRVANQVITLLSRGLFFIIPLTFFILAYFPKGWIKQLTSAGVLALVFGSLLKWFWTTGFSNTPHLWGFLPTSDAGIYFQEAYGLLLGNPLNGAATYRPLSTLFFSSLFWICKLDLMTSLWVMVYLNLFANLIASYEIYKTHGPLAAALYLSGGTLFYKFYAGTFMTEQLGFLLANLAFASLWNGVHTNSRRNILLGIFLLSIGLNVRAGAMFVLLGIPIWVGFHYRKSTFTWKFSGIALLIALSGFAVNALVGAIFVGENGASFSNIGHTLYGVAVGNKGYFQIYLDHPGVTSSEATRIAVTQIINNPFLFLQGVINAYMDYINPTGCWAFCYLRFFDLEKNVLVLLLMILGIGYIIKNWRKPLPQFMIFSLLGVLLSVPFAPTIDVGYRSYTVTNPFLTSLLFIWFPWIKPFWKRLVSQVEENRIRGLSVQDTSESLFTLTYPLLGVVIGLTMILPLALFAFKPLKVVEPNQTCGSDEHLVSVMTNHNSWIHVVSDEELPQGISIPYATSEKLSELVNKSLYHRDRGFGAFQPYLKSGQSIGFIPYKNPDSSTFLNYNLVMAIVDTNDLPRRSGLIQFCGKDVSVAVNQGGAVQVRTYLDIKYVEGYLKPDSIQNAQ